MKFYPEKLRTIRKQKGITVAELASRIDSNRTSISNWERSYQIPSEKRIRMLASGLDIPVSEISDLKDYSTVSRELPQLASSWIELAEASSQNLQKMQKDYFGSLSKLFKIVEESSVLIKALLKSLPISFYVKSPNSQYITANNRFYKELLSSYSHKSIVGLSDKDVFPFREALANEKEDERVISTNIPVISKEQTMPGTRKKKTALTTKTPILDKFGQVAGLLGVFVDITDRKSEEQQRLLLEAAINKLPYMVFIGTFKGEKFLYSFLSKGMEDIFCTSVESFTQYRQVVSDFIHEDDKKDFCNWRTDPTALPRIIKFRIVTEEGIKWLEEEREKKEIMGKEFYFGTIKDISAQRKQEKALQFLLGNICRLNRNKMCYGILDKNRRLIFSDKLAYEEVLGIPRSVPANDFSYWLNLVHPDDREKQRSFVKNKSTDLPLVREYRLIHPKKGLRWIRATASAYLDYIVSFSEDITDEKTK